MRRNLIMAATALTVACTGALLQCGGQAETTFAPEPVATSVPSFGSGSAKPWAMQVGGDKGLAAYASALDHHGNL